MSVVRESVVTKVLVSGCFDMLHSGHVEFFQRAAACGDELVVALGSDKTIFDLKGRLPVNSESERRFMVQNVSCVHQALISNGSGYFDFEPELRTLRPDVFVVNEDGNTPDKRRLVESLGIEYVVLQRTPHDGLHPRSTTALPSSCAAIQYNNESVGFSEFVGLEFRIR